MVGPLMASATMESLENCGVLPVVVLDDAKDAVPLAQALLLGGVDCAEVTLRTDAGMAAIESLRSLEGFVVGAGTVVSAAEADACVAAGARFVVSPGLDQGVVESCVRLDVPVVPGVATATEVMKATALGLSVLKFFPAEQMGGMGTIRALRGPFPGVRFIPSGGVTLDNAKDYADDAIPTVSTSWIAPRALIAQGDFDLIASRAKTFREAVTRPAS